MVSGAKLALSVVEWVVAGRGARRLWKPPRPPIFPGYNPRALGEGSARMRANRSSAL